MLAGAPTYALVQVTSHFARVSSAVVDSALRRDSFDEWFDTFRRGTVAAVAAVHDDET
jgi:hypothetical protein